MCRTLSSTARCTSQNRGRQADGGYREWNYDEEEDGYWHEGKGTTVAPWTEPGWKNWDEKTYEENWEDNNAGGWHTDYENPKYAESHPGTP